MEERMFTEAEVEQILERRFAKAEQKIEERIRQVREKARAEAMARAAEAPAASYSNSDLDRQERILQERERLLAEREMRVRALDALAERGLPSGLADILVMSSPEDFEKNLEMLDREFRKELRSEIDKRLAASSAPLTRGGSSWTPQPDPAVKTVQRMAAQKREDNQKAHEILEKYL